MLKFKSIHILGVSIESDVLVLPISPSAAGKYHSIVSDEPTRTVDTHLAVPAADTSFSARAATATERRRRQVKRISEMTYEEIDASLFEESQQFESPFYDKYEPQEILGR